MNKLIRWRWKCLSCKRHEIVGNRGNGMGIKYLRRAVASRHLKQHSNREHDGKVFGLLISENGREVEVGKHEK